MRTISVSQLAAFRRCPRLWHIKYALGYEAQITDPVLRFGSLTHFGLEAWFRALMVAGLSKEAVLHAALMAVERSGEADPFDRIRAEVLIEGYHHRWIDAGLVPLAVEAEFHAPMVNPATDSPSQTWELHGFIDVVAREPGGRVVLVEHKTSSEDLGVGSTYWQRLRMDSQVSVYFDGALALGYLVEACVYDVLGKPAIRPSETVPVLDKQGLKIVVDPSGARVKTKRGEWRQSADTAQGFALQVRNETPEEFRLRLREVIAENPERYYQRGEVVRLEEELADHRFDVWQLGRVIRENELANRAPRNPDGCAHYGRLCSFFDVCSGAASLTDTARFVKRTTKEEWTNGTTATNP